MTEPEANLGLSPCSMATLPTVFVVVFVVSVGTLVFQMRPLWPGMKTTTLRTEEKRMMKPIIMKAALEVICLKQNPNATAPTFPPAPMIPDIDPLNLGLM